MAKGSSKELGKYLKSKREAKGISIEEMANALKITAINITNIESGNIESIGLSEVFVKSYIKSYIMELGESPEDVFNQFYDFQSKENIKEKNELNSSTIFYNIIVEIVAVIAFAVIFYLFVSYISSKDTGSIDLSKISTPEISVKVEDTEKGRFSEDYNNTYMNYSETPR